MVKQQELAVDEMKEMTLDGESMGRLIYRVIINGGRQISKPGISEDEFVLWWKTFWELNRLPLNVDIVAGVNILSYKVPHWLKCLFQPQKLMFSVSNIRFNDLGINKENLVATTLDVHTFNTYTSLMIGNFRGDQSSALSFTRTDKVAIDPATPNKYITLSGVRMNDEFTSDEIIIISDVCADTLGFNGPFSWDEQDVSQFVQYLKKKVTQ